MKIVALQAENFKRLVAVNIRPDGALVQLTGKNKQGKSSILDAIWVALAGKSVAPSQPIRNGAESATIKLDMGDVIVTRTFGRTGEKGETYATKVTVEKADGAHFPKPQAMLDSLIDTLSFDPLAFERMKPADQFNALRGFVPGFDFQEFENAQLGDFNRRTDVNRKAKEAKAAADVIAIPAGSEDLTAVDEAAIISKIAGASDANTQLERRKLGREQTVNKIKENLDGAKHLRLTADTIDAEAEALATQILEEAKAKVEDVRAAAAEKKARTLQDADTWELDAKTLQEKLDTAEALPDPVDVPALQAELADAQAKNRIVANIERKTAKQEEAKVLEAEAEQLTARMAAREREKEAQVSAAKMPVEGLGFGDKCILLNGLPFDQASDAERLRVSCAIAMAANPKLRVLRVRDGNHLDSEALALLEKIVTDNDYQCWIERVDETGRVGFIIEDGHARQAPAEEKQATLV